jgi:RNA polymerase sigma factor (sigma-70 family)
MDSSRQLDAAVTDDDAIAETIRREQPRLRAWLRRQLPEAQDIEDILQDAFYELVIASRLVEPVRNAGAWLFTIVRNRVTDRHRRRSHRAGTPYLNVAGSEDTEELGTLDDLLPDAEADPERACMRARLVLALEDALRELPEDQRAVFVAHEVDGLSFKAIAQASAAGINTLLWRKHAAVKALRMRLQSVHDELSGN